MVKAAVLEEYSKPFKIKEVDLKPMDSSWVPVAVKAVGVCGRDVVVWRGGFPNLKPPLILGHEIFGEYRGKPVGVYPAIADEECFKAMEAYRTTTVCRNYVILGEGVPGGYAETVYVPERNLVELPDSDYAKYAAAVCGVATMTHAARVAGVGGGDRVLVTGASGGVGIHGVQLLTHMGVRVYGLTRSSEKAKILEKLGVKAVTSFSQVEGKVDAVFEIVGAATFNESMRLLKPRGVLVLIGNVEGKPIEITRPALLVMREIVVTGTAAYTLDEYRAAVKLVAEGVVQPFYRLYRLDDINKAYSDVVSGRVVGRAVLVP